MAQTCRFLQLNDYPLAVGAHNRSFFSDQDKFDRFYLPLAAGVNPGAGLLRLIIIQKAKEEHGKTEHQLVNIAK